MVRPLSVLLLLVAIAPPPEAVSVPAGDRAAPQRLTSEPVPTAWMMAPVLVKGDEVEGAAVGGLHQRRCWWTVLPGAS